MAMAVKNTTFETISDEYKLRNKINVLTDYDVKLVQSILKLRKNYSNELENRKCSVFLKEPIETSIFDKKNKKQAETTKKEKLEETPKICEAIQMNGNQCKAKSKSGQQYCGRHCKK